MEAPTVYIDGQQGTTGLRVRQMLAARADLQILLIPPEQRKDPQVRAEYLNRADIAILCLPDDAAAEAVALIDNPATRVIDTSTERRVHPDWVYGLPELSPAQRQAIVNGRRVANTGCYPVGFTLAVRPLIEAGLLDPEVQLTVNAVSGYSGGGRKMVEAYEQSPGERLPLRLYSLGKVHKHVAEMHAFSLTRRPPLFVPSVSDAFCGMLVSTPIPAASLTASAAQIYAVWQDYYRGCPLVRVGPPDDAGDLWSAGTWMDQSARNLGNQVDLCAFAVADHGVLLVGRLDNLGKGAAGNAVQCLNLMLGLPETAGLL